MSKPLLTVIGVLLAAVLALGYVSYAQAKRNGELSNSIDIANAANKQWAEAHIELQREVNARQNRLDEAITREEARQRSVREKEVLFRTEIDKLKEQNHELKQLLETRIPDSVLERLCAGNYASTSVCEGLL